MERITRPRKTANKRRGIGASAILASGGWLRSDCPPPPPKCGIYQGQGSNQQQQAPGRFAQGSNAQEQAETQARNGVMQPVIPAVWCYFVVKHGSAASLSLFDELFCPAGIRVPASDHHLQQQQGTLGRLDCQIKALYKPIRNPMSKPANGIARRFPAIVGFYLQFCQSVTRES